MEQEDIQNDTKLNSSSITTANKDSTFFKADSNEQSLYSSTNRLNNPENNEDKNDKKIQEGGKKVIDLTVWFLIFTIAIIKDFIDMFGTLVSLAINAVPILGQAACIILQYFFIILSLILGALLFFLLFFKGKTGIAQRMRQLILQLFGSAVDSIPLLNFVPLTSIIIFIVFLMEKSDLQKMIRPSGKDKNGIQKITGTLLKSFQT